MNKDLIAELCEFFKSQYGLSMASAADLLRTETDLLECLMRLGREAVGRLFEESGNGYVGPRAQKDGVEFHFVEHRWRTVHGLFGAVNYQRAYYASGSGEGWAPMDERLGIARRHTPACQYFLSTFTAREAYQESLNQFHEIFRPDGADRISMRKALDMDYELGRRLEDKRQQEIQDQFERNKPITTEREIEGTMVVSIDATKVRLKGEERVDTEGRTRYETEFRDAKIAVISALGWDERNEQPYCTDSSYVSGIEYADDFFRRIWVEMNRRCGDLSKIRLVFIGDGANWIWDRVCELANDRSSCILDFYHAIEHLSDLCKALYGEGSESYWQRYRGWGDMLWDGQVGKLIDELKELRDGTRRKAQGDLIQGQINYFEQNARRMDYRSYRSMRLPIGSGTVESGCKNVIGSRLKQGGMTWSPLGADGMLQIRSSLKGSRFKRDFTEVLSSTSHLKAA